jgi:ABC-type uncharacterized transport system auxiliary subunit
MNLRGNGIDDRDAPGPATGRRLAQADSARRATLAVIAATLLGGCVSVRLGSTDVPGMTHYVLADARAAASTAPAAGASARLAIQSLGGDAVADSIALVYSRRPGERAFYQFAAWSERPSRRLAQLAEQRLEAGGRFASVTQLGQPVATDWLLTLTLDTLVHDVSSSPGQVHVVLRAELIRRTDRSRAAQRAFTATAPVAEASAPAAVAAFSVATADVLNQLAGWVERSVEANAAR